MYVIPPVQTHRLPHRYRNLGTSLADTNIPHRLSVLELGGPASHVYFVQHGSYAAQAQRLLGKEVVDKEYPMDHTHTAPFLADVVRLPFSLHEPSSYRFFRKTLS
jgi:hypothetical protein